MLFRFLIAALATASTITAAPAAVDVTVDVSVFFPARPAAPNAAPKQLQLGAWQKIPGRLHQIDVSQNGNTVVGTASNGTVWKAVGGRWQKLPGALKHVTACDDGSLWGVNKENNVYRSKTSNGPWTQIQGALSYIDCGPQGVWATHQGLVYKWNGSLSTANKPGPSPWTRIPGGLDKVSSGASGVWGVNGNDAVYKLNFDGKSWTRVQGALNVVESGPETVYGINAAGDVYYAGDKGWVKIEGRLVSVAATANKVYGITYGDEIVVKSSF
ncbi:hypothetical protein HDU97_007868 [Phlyctochytrium planicorne]|nr:hypothetical protein HDU97_007868 [Phlyctochytrium planicorne]